MEFVESGNPKKMMFAKIASVVPTNMPPRFLPAIRDNITHFVNHEMSRWDTLMTYFNGDTRSAWDFLKPVATEYEFDNQTIGIKFRADVIFKIPENFYKSMFGPHPTCLQVDDYKTSNVPSFSLGFGWNGEQLSKPIIVAKVKGQLVFEALMMDIFKINGYNELSVLFGGVFYSGGDVYVLEQITMDDKDNTLKDLVKLHKRLSAPDDQKDFRFNMKWCKFCDFAYACTGGLTIGEKMDIYKLSESQKKERGEQRNESMNRQKRARRMLLDKIHELHICVIPLDEEPESDTDDDDQETGTV